MEVLLFRHGLHSYTYVDVLYWSYVSFRGQNETSQHDLQTALEITDESSHNNMLFHLRPKRWLKSTYYFFIVLPLTWYTLPASFIKISWLTKEPQAFLFKKSCFRSQKFYSVTLRKMAQINELQMLVTSLSSKISH